MDVRLPDGTVIKNVPDGITRDQLVAKLSANGYDVAKLGGPAPKPLVIGGEALPGFIKEEAQSRSLPAQFIAGAGTALDSAAYRLKQAVTGLTPEDEARVRANRGLTSTPAGLGGGIAGSVAMTAMPAARIQGALTGLAARALPAAIAPTAAAAATGGAVAAGTNPVLQGESELMNAGLGAAGGALGDVASRGLARLAQPIRQSADVRTLMRNGVIPTPGQAAGATSFVGRMEQKLMSLPLVGHVIRSGRERATEEFNIAAIAKSLPKDSQGAITKAGRAAIDKADEVIGSAYDKVYSGIKVVPDDQFLDDIIKIKSSKDLALPKDIAARFDELINQQVLSRMQQGGQIPGQVAQRVDSQLGSLARRYTTDLDADKRVLGLALREAQKSFKGLLERNAGPETSEVIKGLNRNYANFLRVERAAAAKGARDGVFTADQLSSAVKALDKSSNKGAFAKGRAVMQDISEAGRNVLGDTVPNSGTADRIAMGMMLGAPAVAGANEYFGGPGYLSALALAPLLYSRGGSRYLLGDLAGQQAASEALRSMAPYASQLGRSVLSGQ